MPHGRIRSLALLNPSEILLAIPSGAPIGKDHAVTWAVERTSPWVRARRRATTVPTKEKTLVDVNAVGMVNVHVTNDNGLHARHRKVLQRSRPLRFAQGLAIGGQPGAQK